MNREEDEKNVYMSATDSERTENVLEALKWERGRILWRICSTCSLKVGTNTNDEFLEECTGFNPDGTPRSLGSGCILAGTYGLLR